MEQQNLFHKRIEQKSEICSDSVYTSMKCSMFPHVLWIDTIIYSFGDLHTMLESLVKPLAPEAVTAWTRQDQ